VSLGTLDWLIIALSLFVCFVPALFFGRRAGQSTSEFFASGRAVPWWLAGLSMVATTFSSDTPNLVTDIVRRDGVAGNWVWWAFVLTGVATVFFYARLWRRSGVLTDLEFYEIRYSGKAASIVRGFRALYLGLFFNCMIMATVNLAACKIAGILFGLPRWQTLMLVGTLNVIFATYSGLWGVLVIDMIQFFIKMSAVVAAAYFAVTAPQIGGLDALMTKLSALRGPGGLDYTRMLPDFTNNWELAVAVFIMPVAVQWWAVWYPGAEPGGGSYIAQRMLASKTEKDALKGVLFFNIAHYVLRPWPWILVALCSLIVYPELADIQKAFPNLDPTLLGHDIAYPAMLKFLPAGFAGLMVGGLIAANSSTIPHAPQLGRVVPRPRFLSPVCEKRRRRAPLRARRTARDRRALHRVVRHRLSDGYGQGRVRHHPADRRGHRPPLSGALVLVACECVVRSRRDDELAFDLGRLAGARQDRHAREPACGGAHHGGHHHRLLGRNGIPRSRNGPSDAHLVLSEGQADRSRMG
jgi:Na+/proline symporter